VEFGMIMHLRPPNLMGNQKFQNPRWWTDAILKIKNLDINRLADFDEILRDGTY